MADTQQQPPQQQTRASAVVALTPGVVSDPGVRGGRPIVEGTRVAVQDITERIAGGWTIDQLLDAFRHLSREQVLEALAYAHALVVARGDTLSGIDDAQRKAWI